ncbi:MAG: hypothetical protein QM802_19650 [Agriterribacter sp.]
MNDDIDSLLHYFFQKNDLEDVDVLEIEQMANAYPYFAPAQFLLAKKYLLHNHDGYQKQAAKTALFFNNPDWLNAQLHPKDTWTNEHEWMNSVISKAEEPVILPTEHLESLNEPTVMPPHIVEEEIKEINIEEHIPLVEEPISGAVFMEEIKTPLEEEIVNQEEITESVETYESEVTGSHENKMNVVELASIIEQEEEDASLLPEENIVINEPALPKLKSILDQEIAPEVAGESIIPIEPLYTIDYFASQGIKVGAEQEGKDKLSIKLRSFTDWLKTMKRIHPEKFETNMDAGSQSAIQHIAEHSNESKEIVTETMAEIYARQGLNQKAAELYHKLSLLNPDKRVYFAAKIAQLKET